MCPICEKYDLCSICEALDIHDHALLKVKMPQQSAEYLQHSLSLSQMSVEKKKPVEKKQVEMGAAPKWIS